MPIVVRHEPDLGLLADIGYTIGQGMQNQYLEEQAQQERMQQRAIDANLMSQRFAQEEMAWRQANQLRGQDLRQQAGFEQATELEEMRNRNRLQLQQLRDEDDREQLESEWKMRRENAILGQLGGMERDMAKGMLDFVNRQRSMIGDMVSKGYQFTDAQRANLDTVMTDVDELLMQAANEDHRLPSLTAAATKMRNLMPAIQGAAPSNNQQAQQDAATVMFDDGSEMKVIRKGDDWAPVKEDNVEAEESARRMKAFDLAIKLLTVGELTAPPTIDEVEKMVARILGTGAQTTEQPKPLNQPGAPLAQPKANTEGMLELPDDVAAALMYESSLGGG